jgi:hypothetical protein
MKKLVIKVKWGGLGDHLLHSPIPRIAKQKHGYDSILISNHSDYLNPNTKRLVWEYNPFVDGFTDEDHDYPQFGSVPDGKNIIDAVIDFYGLPDDGERHREPEIYYKPITLPEFADTSIFEPNHGNAYGIPSAETIEKYFRDNHINITYQMKPRYQNKPVPNLPIIEADVLERFCDVIHSCKAFYCLMSGVATLVAALHKSATVLYTDGILPMFLHSKLHNYVKL